MSVMSCPCCTFLPDDLFLPKFADTRTPLPPVLSTSSADYPNSEQADPVAGVPLSPSPKEALQKLKAASQTAEFVLFDSHGHPQLQRAGVVSSESSGDSNITTDDDDNEEENHGTNITTISIVCAVSPADWHSTLAYASEKERYETTLPGIGVHPWQCYPNLTPNYLLELEELVRQHPSAIVGEIGLCKVAKFVRSYPAELGGKQGALKLQRDVFRDQFLLAARLCRPVSIHCVQQHGVLIKMLKEIREDALSKRREWRKTKQRKGDNAASDATTASSVQDDEPNIRDSFPASIAMHSYTGTAHHIKELLDFEASLNVLSNDKSSKSTATSIRKPTAPAAAAQKDVAKNNDDDNHSNMKPLFYFGFSYTVNVAMCSSEKSRSQNIDAIRALPANRILAESDVHRSVDVKSGTAAAVAYLAGAVGISIAEMANQTASNGIQFLSSVRPSTNHDTLIEY